MEKKMTWNLNKILKIKIKSLKRKIKEVTI